MFEFFKNLFSNTISDEEVNAHEWVLCPNCQVNIMKEDLMGNDWVCPNCHSKIQF